MRTISQNEYDGLLADRRVVGIIAAIVGAPPDVDPDRLVDRVKRLREALEGCVAELATLRARLTEPYASNVAATIQDAQAVLKYGR